MPQSSQAVWLKLTVAFIPAKECRPCLLHSWRNYLSDVHYMPNTVLGACVRAINKGDTWSSPPPWSLFCRRTGRRNVHYYTCNWFKLWEVLRRGASGWFWALIFISLSRTNKDKSIQDNWTQKEMKVINQNTIFTFKVRNGLNQNPPLGCPQHFLSGRKAYSGNSSIIWSFPEDMLI